MKTREFYLKYTENLKLTKDEAMSNILSSQKPTDNEVKDLLFYAHQVYYEFVVEEKGVPDSILQRSVDDGEFILKDYLLIGLDKSLKMPYGFTKKPDCNLLGVIKVALTVNGVDLDNAYIKKYLMCDLPNLVDKIKQLIK